MWQKNVKLLSQLIPFSSLKSLQIKPTLRVMQSSACRVCVNCMLLRNVFSFQKWKVAYGLFFHEGGKIWSAEPTSRNSEHNNALDVFYAGHILLEMNWLLLYIFFFYWHIGCNFLPFIKCIAYFYGSR